MLCQGFFLSRRGSISTAQKSAAQQQLASLTQFSAESLLQTINYLSLSSKCFGYRERSILCSIRDRIREPNSVRWNLFPLIAVKQSDTLDQIAADITYYSLGLTVLSTFLQRNRTL